MGVVTSSDYVSISGANGNLDAFGKLRVSLDQTQQDFKQIHNNFDIFTDSYSSGSASVVGSAVDASRTISVTGGTDKYIFQSKQRGAYQSGKSQKIFMTFSGFQSETDVTKRLGYFSSSSFAPHTADLDGIFLQSDSTGVSINIYKTGTLTEQTYQSDWSNKSKVSDVDWTKSQILIMDFEWLGVGIVRWGLVRNGAITYFHISRHDNNIDGVYMSSPNQPLRWEIESSGGAGSFKFICAAISSEGAQNQIGAIRTENLGADFINANSTSEKYALLGIQLDNNYSGTLVDILKFSILGTTNDNLIYEVWYNPTVDGTFNYNSVTNSSILVAKGDPGGTNTLTIGAGAICLYSGYLSQQTAVDFEFENSIRLGTNIDGTTDQIVLAVQPLSTNLDVYGSITWRELQ